jgi:hypothetical protein
MVDFMIGARHYVGTTDKIRNLSWAWRDGDFFNWSMRTLVAQYLSNPAAFERMEKTIVYQKNEDFPKEYTGKWGKLKPYHPDAPDILKLMHWDADVKISQGLEHEHQKAELAHFLYAFPYLKKWLPQQNFDVVFQYLKEKWTKSTVAPYSTTQYDKSPNHDLTAIKTQLGTLKGELAPGHSVIPNLMMYEVAIWLGEHDAENYFDAAFQQMEWMIAHLDWTNPLTTKGQRMSEHFTLRAFAFFYTQYKDRAPKGLYDKVAAWAKIMIDRSQNMWDFRKFEANGDWIPYGWNETGNVLGFPCAAFAAILVLEEEALKQELNRLAWAHFDNAFGRNPTGRHFSYDAPKEIEGVDTGWYSYHHGGVGLLEEVPFVFDGSPKSFHYPNNYEVGNLGWTEGWVPFNTAFNVSMAYLARTTTNISIKQIDNNHLEIRLKAPLNFDEKIKDKVSIFLEKNNGETHEIILEEEGAYSPYLSAKIKLKKNFWQRLSFKKGLKVAQGDSLSVSYGLGYFKDEASVLLR